MLNSDVLYNITLFWETGCYNICVPKEEGGLGVRRLREFNVPLLGKWCWWLLVDKEGLWYQVLKARYGEEGVRVREAGRHSSLWWRMVCKVRGGVGEGGGNWFEGNIRREVENGIGTFVTPRFPTT